METIPEIPPKRLILELLSTLRGQSMPVRGLVAASGLFGIAENSLRVALNRLTQRGLIERSDPGSYRLASDALPVQRHVASWSELRRSPRWAGAWVGAHTAGLGRTRRSALRARERALALLGFRALESDLWIRPDCLEAGVDDLRARLRELGLDSSAPVFRLDALDEETEARARGLWDVQALCAGYRRRVGELERSEARLPQLSPERAMVETFVLGGRCIRELAFDPRLPEPILPAAELRAFVRATRRYDQLGRSLWSRFMRSHGAPYRKSVMDLNPEIGEVPRALASGGLR